MAGEAIFIGYRRDDTADVAGRIYDAMTQRFGRARIFKDVDNISPGVDFGDYINGILPRCRVALILIGPHWLDAKDDNDKRRIDDDHDWVRIEIETALATPGLLVTPVLVNGARMPRGDEVPDSLKALLRLNAAIIRRDPDFHDDVERLATALRASVETGNLDLASLGGSQSATQDGIGETIGRSIAGFFAYVAKLIFAAALGPIAYLFMRRWILFWLTLVGCVTVASLEWLRVAAQEEATHTRTVTGVAGFGVPLTLFQAGSAWFMVQFSALAVFFFINFIPRRTRDGLLRGLFGRRSG
jgi:hypothetical protein